MVVFPFSLCGDRLTINAPVIGICFINDLPGGIKFFLHNFTERLREAPNRFFFLFGCYTLIFIIYGVVSSSRGLITLIDK